MTTAPTITTASQLPNGIVNQPYSATLQATGGTTPYTWSLASGSSLPSGLALSGSTGSLSGTPTAAATSSFTIQLTDSSSPVNVVSRSFTLAISAGPMPLAFTTASSLPNGSVNQPYNVVLQATGGTSPYTWSLANGSSLPSGLMLNSGTGLLSGTPTASGTSSFTIQLKDSSSPAQTAAQTFSLTISVSPKTYANGQILAAGITPALDNLGDVAVVGSGTNATVFVKTAGAWSQAARLSNPANTVSAVAISGDGNTIVVGDCLAGTCDGNAYVYVAPPGGWSQATGAPSLVLSHSAASRFGYAVAVDRLGDTVAIGDPADVTTGSGAGTVYVFSLSGGAVSSVAQLTLSNGQNNLGISVSIDSSGDTIVVGQTSTSSATATSPGFAYVFVKPSGGWANTSTPDATLSSPGVVNGDEFGRSVAISSDGKTVVAGAPSHSFACYPATCANGGPGAAYVYVNSSAPLGWSSRSENAVLTASAGQNGDNFGYSSAISSNGATVVVGAFNARASAGSVYVFGEPAGGWMSTSTPFQTLSAFTGPAAGSRLIPTTGFGTAVSLGGDASALAAGGYGTVGVTAQAVVYLFH